MASRYKPHKHFGAKAHTVLDIFVFHHIFDVEIYCFCQSSEWLKPVAVCQEVQSMRGS